MNEKSTNPIHRLREGWAILAAFVLVGWPHGAIGSEGDHFEVRMVEGPSLADVVDYAFVANPRISAAHAEWRESLERYRVETALPDPQVSTTYWPRSVADDLDSRKTEVMLSQEIPYPGKLGAAGAVARAEAAQMRIRLDQAVRDAIVAVRESYHELAYIRAARKIGEQNQALIGEIRALGETAYARDQAALRDVLKAQSQTAQSGYDLLLLTELESTETARLNALLNRPAGASIGPLRDNAARPLVYTLDEIYGLAEKGREEIRIARAGVETAEARLDLARYQKYPDFMVGFLYENSATEMTDAAREDSFGVQFGVTLPIWFGKNAGRTAAAQAGVEKSLAMAADAINETRALVRDVYFRIENAGRLVTLYRDQLIPQAFTSLQTSETWNRQGVGSLSDYVEAQSVWYNFQLALARARADQGKYLARLEGLAGRSLTDKGDPRPAIGEDAP